MTIKMDNLQKLLEQSGLTEKEAAVYLAALELGQCTILQIANRSKIKRSTVYEIIPILESKNLLKTTNKGNKVNFLAENPKTIANLIAEKEKQFKEALPELLAMYKSQETRPDIFFFEGKDEIQNMYEDTIREGKPICNFTSIINLYSYLDREWVDGYIKRRVKANVPTRIIAIDSLESQEWQKNSSAELREIKLVPAHNFSFSGDLQVYGNKIIITTYQKHLMSVLLEDKNISTMLRMMFTLIWTK